MSKKENDQQGHWIFVGKLPKDHPIYRTGHIMLRPVGHPGDKAPTDQPLLDEESGERADSNRQDPKP